MVGSPKIFVKNAGCSTLEGDCCKFCTDFMAGLYKMGTFHERTGIAPETLRAWERRYGLLEPERGPGGHRLYTDEDLRVMRRVLTLLESGRSIGEIARMGRRALLASVPATSDGSPVERWREAILDCAANLDEGGIARTLDEAFASLSPLRVVHEVLVPTAREVGDRWARGELSIAAEHLVSAAFEGRLRALAALFPVGDARPVICAQVPTERHGIGLLVVGLVLASAGLPVVHLGDLPLGELDAVFDRLKPRAACFSVMRSEVLDANEDELAGLAGRHADVSFFVGGRGVCGPRPTLEALDVRLWQGYPLDRLVAAVRRT